MIPRNLNSYNHLCSGVVRGNGYFTLTLPRAMLQSRNKSQCAGSSPAARIALTLLTAFSAGAARMTVCEPE